MTQLIQEGEDRWNDYLSKGMESAYYKYPPSGRFINLFNIKDIYNKKIKPNPIYKKISYAKFKAVIEEYFKVSVQAITDYGYIFELTGVGKFYIIHYTSSRRRVDMKATREAGKRVFFNDDSDVRYKIYWDTARTENIRIYTYLPSRSIKREAIANYRTKNLITYDRPAKYKDQKR